MICQRALAAALLLVGTLTLAACAGVADHTKYYVLSPMRRSRAASSPPPFRAPPLAWGRRRFPAISTGRRSSPATPTTTSRSRPTTGWAEPLESGIAQVLSDDLAAQLGSERITVLPWRGDAARVLDYQVIVVVLRFDGSAGRDVTLDVRWRLLGKDRHEVALKRSTLKEPISGSGYQSIVRGMNRTLARLAGEIAAEIRSRADTRAAGS